MGNHSDWHKIDNNFVNEKNLHENLLYIDSIENSNEALALGQIQIYKFNYDPYEYVMKHRRIFFPDD
jgi:hypothetical protein